MCRWTSNSIHSNAIWCVTQCDIVIFNNVQMNLQLYSLECHMVVLIQLYLEIVIICSAKRMVCLLLFIIGWKMVIFLRQQRKQHWQSPMYSSPILVITSASQTILLDHCWVQSLELVLHVTTLLLFLISK